VKGTEVNLPTDHGEFNLIPYIQKSNGLEHVALTKGTWSEEEEVLVRVHSSCVTGDIFGSYRCDCGDQLHEAMRLIQEKGQGVIVYLNQEGRGIGLYNKMEAYKLQEEGRDTVEANVELGFKEDERDYGIGAGIIHSLGIRNIRLLTNNPIKRAGLEGYGMTIVETIPLEVPANKHNQFYLETKRDKMGHFLNIAKYENPHKDGE
jgi:3,4-dihydroxy 2-butanone 4-phosphate synthase/GTP cyclohydrolase II